MTPERLLDLHQGWHLADVPAQAGPAAIRAVPEADWLPAAVPGTVQGALLAAGRIPDPFLGDNERRVQWVGERTWAWRLPFDVDALAPNEDLVFEGLDTCCTVWLNGQCLFSSANMFVPRRVDVHALLRVGGNELLLRFDPPLAQARAQEAALGQRPLWNGDSARLYLRKAQYHFGWDWGPVLLTSGPWQPVRRHAWSARLDEVQVQPQVDLSVPDAPRATVAVRTRVMAGGAGADLRVVHELQDPAGAVVARQEARLPTGADAADARVVDASLAVAHPQLWWPRGLGGQPLYTLRTEVLAADGQVLARDQRRIGLRQLRLVQAPVQGERGRSFCFEVNGQEFFAGGANWIPDDNLLERISPARYRERVAQAAAGHMNMLRVWGGGLYEDEAFYDACDELGLLVWQDFLFACGLYPAHPAFTQSVREEAAAAIKRLRHRASLAIWCGNNEDYAVAESVGAYGPQAPLGRFDARALYEQVLPELCLALDPGRPYWPGSPYSPQVGGILNSADPSVGDRHSWEVWHQQMLPYQRYHEVQARFVSEFGMQSHASLEVLEAALPPDQHCPCSAAAMWHNKAGSGAPDGHRRLAVYLADNLRVGSSLAEHVYATQFVQAEAMRYAYQDFRRRFQRPGARACSGALVWQLNDCWPATSWAIIDSAGTPKPAWHSIRRALAPLAVALRLAPGQATLAVMNAAAACPLALTLRVFDLDGRLVHQARVELVAPAHTSQEQTLALPAFDVPVVGELQAEALQGDALQGGQALARDVAWPEPFKFHRFALKAPQFEWAPDAGGTCGGTDTGTGTPTGAGSGVLTVHAPAPVKGLWLQAPGTHFADNFIDLVPGSPVQVPWQGAVPRQLRWTALDHGTHPAAPTRAGG